MERPILVVPDLHVPFQHPRAFEFLKAAAKFYRVQRRIVQIGDLVDLHSASRHIHDPDGRSSGDEFALAKETIREFNGVFPEGDWVLGNHDDRPDKVLARASLSRKFLQEYTELWGLKGWKTHRTLIRDGVEFRHQGVGTSTPALAVAKLTGRSTVCGHNHTVAGVHYFNNGEGQRFGLDTGALIDDTTYAFEYSKTTILRSCYGCGIIWGPNRAEWVPMEI